MAADIPAFGQNGWLPPGHHKATWDQVLQLFRNGEGSRRAALTDRLLQWRDALVQEGVTGFVLLDGSYVSAKAEPSDFDVLLVAQPEVQALKDSTPRLRELLDEERCEKELGFSVLFCSSNSVVLDLLKGSWDTARDGVTRKGVLEVPL